MPQELSGTPLVASITAVSALGFFLMGYDNGLMSNLITLPEFLDQYNPTTNQTGSIVAFFSLGAAIGAFVSISFVETIGRIRSIQIGASIMMIGAIIMTSSQNITQLIAGRLVAGIGLGCNTSAIPAWQSECCSKYKRGALLAIDIVCVAAGLTFSFWLEYGVNEHQSGQFKFRFPIGFQLIFEVAILVAMFFLPESPRWLAVHGKKESSLSVLARLRGKGTTPTDHIINAQYDAIMVTAELEGALDSNNFAALFTMGKTKNFKRLVLGAGVQFLSPWINVITFYFPYILLNVLGKSQATASIIGGLYGVVVTIVILPSVYFVERIGRKPLFTFGSAGLSVCFCIMTGMLYYVLNYPDSPNVESYGSGAIAMIFIYAAIFANSWMPLSFTYAAELMPIGIRSKGCSIATTCYWIGSFATSEIVPIAMANIGWKFFILFCITNFCFAFIFWFFYPETKSLSLEEIDLIFTGDIDAVAEAAGKIHEGALADEKEKGAVNAIEMENV